MIACLHREPQMVNSLSMLFPWIKTREKRRWGFSEICRYGRHWQWLDSVSLNAMWWPQLTRTDQSAYGTYSRSSSSIRILKLTRCRRRSKTQCDSNFKRTTTSAQGSLFRRWTTCFSAVLALTQESSSTTSSTESKSKRSKWEHLFQRYHFAQMGTQSGWELSKVGKSSSTISRTASESNLSSKAMIAPLALKQSNFRAFKSHHLHKVVQILLQPHSPRILDPPLQMSPTNSIRVPYQLHHLVPLQQPRAPKIWSQLNDTPPIKVPSFLKCSTMP